MRPRPDDIFVCAFPKSGTTWIQHIVHQLLAMGYVSPMIEGPDAASVEAMESPRILKSHLTYADIPKGGGAKYIYVCRNPKDCLTSFYHHHRTWEHYEFEHGDFDVFFDLFMDGRISFGDYFDHLNSWLESIEKQEENILFLKYEDMLVDLPSAVVQISNFLEGKAAEIVKDEKKLDKIIEASSLASMKMNQNRWFSNIYFQPIHRDKFIRKGGSRDWKNHFSLEQSERMDERFRQRLTASAAGGWWKKEMAWEGGQNENAGEPRMAML
ncbi:hypothetical protein PMAYCL1PPCAC_25187 [Pristionchus mayeri]|uniref:Sulfotransferase domain-containing protein n=1 Tax=Pristionchus mayeri TaxID=1317129 RepID=A0AAN5D2Q0_9BILA|nr:hypothetical protein PMAYCL1PPCAC_25187 [Pristionchus mayeri]